MNIPQLNLTTQYHSIKSEIDSAIQSVLESGIAINYSEGSDINSRDFEGKGGEKNIN